MQEYDSSKPETQCLMLDVCALYSYTIQNSRICDGEYAWIEDKTKLDELKKKNILNLSADDDVSYLLEVDIYCPAELHHKFRDFPLLPQTRRMKKGNVNKLIADLLPKKKYVTHYMSIVNAIQLG